MKILDHEQGSEAWLQAREGVITGSEVKRVYGTAAADYRHELIANALAPAKEKGTSEAMERGTELEEDAIAVYEMEHGLTEEVGLCIHDEYDWLGVSPDRLVKKGKKYVGAVEAKCPDTKTHIKYIEYDKIPTEYLPQVKQYFLVNQDLEWLDFISYDPRIQVPEWQLFVKRVTREELQDDLDEAMDKLLKFRAKWEKLITKYIF